MNFLTKLNSDPFVLQHPHLEDKFSSNSSITEILLGLNEMKIDNSLKETRYRRIKP